MHLLCRDDDCPGSVEPAGSVDDLTCRFCGSPLADESGNVIAQGVGPLVEAGAPRSFDALAAALRDAGHEVRVVELTSVRVGDQLLVSSLDQEGGVLDAEVCEGSEAREIEDAIDQLAEGD